MSLRMCVCDVMEDAADEIVRLRALVDQCDHHETSLQEAQTEIDRLISDNRSLRVMVETYRTTELKAAVRAYPREFMCARCANLKE
jgi:hypothetical protein